MKLANFCSVRARVWRALLATFFLLDEASPSHTPMLHSRKRNAFRSREKCTHVFCLLKTAKRVVYYRGGEVSKFNF
jgi:hypothetical protein